MDSSSSSTQPPPDSPPQASPAAVYLENILLKADSLGNAKKFEEAYELLFSTALANSLWIGGNMGWPLVQFEEKAELVEKALSFAENVSISFHERAIVETKVLLSSDDDDNISEVVNNLKGCRMHDSFRGVILCLKQLLTFHTNLDLSEYTWPNNLFGLDNSCMEDMMIKRELSFETLFYCWKCLKQSMEILGNYFGGEFNVVSELSKFVLSFLGLWNLDDSGTYILLMPEAKWLETLGTDWLKMNGGFSSVEFQGWATCAKGIWNQEMVVFALEGYNELCRLVSFAMDNDISSAVHFTLLLHTFEVIQFIQPIKACRRVLKDTVSNKFEKFRKIAASEFCNFVDPLGWDTSMNKDMALVRKDGSVVATEYLRKEIRGKDRLSESDTLLAAQMILCTPKLTEEVYMAIMKKVRGNKPWYDFIGCYVQKVSELEKFWAFYSAVERNLNRAVEQNLDKEEGIVATNRQLYMIERLLALTSLANGTMYVTKSTLADLLVQHDELSIPRLCSLGDIRPEQLEEIHRFFVNFLADFSENLDWMEKWGDFPFIASRAVVCACLLHITFGEEHFNLLNNMLLSEMVTSHLPSKFREVLELGRKESHIDLKVVARALKKLDNPLMIVKVKDESLLIVYADSDFDSKDDTGDCFCFWDGLQAIVNAAGDSSPNITDILEFFDSWIPLLYSSMQNPVSLANKYEMRELNVLLAEMEQLFEELKQNSLSCTDLVVDLSKKILSRQSRMSHVLNQQLLLCQGNDQDEETAESEAENNTDEDDEEADIDTDEEDEEADINTDGENEERVDIETDQEDTTDEDLW